MSKGSLTFPTDPLAAMRELSELDNTPLQPATNDILTSSSQDSLIDSSQDSITSVKQDSKIDSNKSRQASAKPDVHPESKPARQAPRRKSVPLAGVQFLPRAAPDGAASLDPLDYALLQKIACPYPDLAKGKATLISSRLPDDIVERLGLAADLVKKHKKTKQDVITRGLILAFEELVENDGAVEWYE